MINQFRQHIYRQGIIFLAHLLNHCFPPIKFNNININLVGYLKKNVYFSYHRRDLKYVFGGWMSIKNLPLDLRFWNLKKNYASYKSLTNVFFPTGLSSQ